MVQVIRGILKVSDPSDVPQSRLERYWREIDLDGSGTVDFEEFVIWMLGGTRGGTRGGTGVAPGFVVCRVVFG